MKQNDFSLLFQFINTNNHLLLEAGMSGIMALMPFLFLLCYIGENVTTSYLDLTDKIFQLSWYMCPVKVQKYIPFMMLHGQKEIYFRSFGSLDCTLDTFKRVRIRNCELAKNQLFVHLFV